MKIEKATWIEYVAHPADAENGPCPNDVDMTLICNRHKIEMEEDIKRYGPDHCTVCQELEESPVHSGNGVGAIKAHKFESNIVFKEIVTEDVLCENCIVEAGGFNEG
jgi:hypothetical protein